MRLTFLLWASVLLSLNGFAEEDGLLEQRSEGRVDIDLTIPETIQFDIAIDMIQQRVTNTGDIVREFPVCVFVNGMSKYSVSVTSKTGQFVLLPASGDVDNAIKFFSYWNDELEEQGRTELQAGVVLRGQQADRNSATRCLNKVTQGNGVFSILIPKSQIAYAKKGVYGVTLSIIISPE